MWNSLRVRLTVILIALAIGPLLAVGAILIQRSFATGSDQAIELQSQVARSVAGQTEALFQGIINDLQSLGGEIEGLERADRAQQISLMLSGLSSGPYLNVYEGLILLNPQGQELLSLSRQEVVPSDRLRSRASSPEFEIPKSTGVPFISPVWFDENTGESFTTIAVPLYQPRSVQLSGVLLANVSFTAVGNLLAQASEASAGPDQTLYIADSQGRIVAHEDKSIDLMSAHIDLPPRAAFQTGLNGTDVVLAVQQLEGSGQQFIAVAEKPASLALELAYATTYTILVIIAAALIISAIIGVMAVRQIVRPIEGLAGLAKHISTGNLTERAQVNSRDEIGILATAFNSMTDQLQDTLSGLERRVADRTHELETANTQSEKRARELQTVGEISSVIASEQNIDALLPLICQLVSKEFGFYHVGIFLLDGGHRFAILQSANSEGGMKMLARGHRLEVGQTGIVGFVAHMGQPRIALDVGADPVFFNNPDLPATRSEIALPLKLRGQVIGVLDVQSTEASAFTDSDADTLAILADQIAIAIDNARLFEESQRALAEAQSSYTQYLNQEWTAFTQKGLKIGYLRSLVDGKELTAPIETDEIRQVLKTGEVLVQNPQDGKSEAAIIMPVKLRGQVIGVLNIKTPSKGRRWSDEEINMTKIISERLALALENARLFEETTRTAEREKLVSDITTSIRSTNDPQVMIEMAVAELRRALGVSRVEIIPQRVSSSGT